MIIIDEHTPPPVMHSGDYWERSADPFHPEAFSNVPARSVLVLMGGKLTQGKRKEGWMLIDWAENPIGFVADGTQYEPVDKPVEYTFHMGPCSHMCAYPPNSEERIAYHQKSIEAKKNFK